MTDTNPASWSDAETRLWLLGRIQQVEKETVSFKYLCDRRMSYLSALSDCVRDMPEGDDRLRMTRLLLASEGYDGSEPGGWLIDDLAYDSAFEHIDESVDIRLSLLLRANGVDPDSWRSRPS